MRARRTIWVRPSPRGLCRRAHVLAILSLALGAAAGPAHASQYDSFGMTPRDIGMGSAMTAAASGWSGLFYNPANLVNRRSGISEQRLGLQLTLTMPSLFVQSDGGGLHEPVLPQTHVGVGVGWVKPLGGIFEERVALGISVYVPTTTLFQIQGLDPQTPHFYYYQNRQNKLLLNLGVAWQPVDWWSIGAGVQIMANLGGTVTLDMNIANGTFDKRELSMSVLPSASAVLGTTFRPLEGLAIGLSYRGDSGLSFDVPMSITEGQALTIDIGVNQTVLWSPHQFSLGVSYTVPALDLTVAVDGTFGLWSQAPDPSPQLTVDIGGSLADAFGLSKGLDVNARSEPLDLQFANTITPRVGVEWGALDWLTLRTGYFFRPTPAPAQTAATAYLDNDTHVVSLGAGFALRDAQRERPAALLIDLALQASVLATRTIVRRDPRDPIGSLRHGGTIWSVSMSVSHSF